MTTAIETRPDARTAAAREPAPNEVVYGARCDIHETADELVVTADMPGVPAVDVQVTYENGVLSLYGRCAPRCREDAEHLLTEYGTGDYRRRFEINEDIDADKIDAEHRNGVLTVRLPKAESAKPRRIKVEG